MMKALTILVLLLCLCFNGYSQSDFRPGVIMPNAKDSVTGLIDYRGDIRNAERCSFRVKSDSSRIYLPFGIYGYRFKGGKFYVSRYIKYKEKTVPSFVEYLVKGKKNLYYVRDGAGGHFLIDYSHDTVIEVVYKVDHFYQDGVEYLGSSKIHQGYLKAYFRDCPELYKEIEDIEVPDITNMVGITKEYHHLTCHDSGCIDFTKKSYKFKVDVEFRLGMVHYLNDSIFFRPQYSGYIHFWLPRSNERLYIITGFCYLPFKLYSNDYSLFTVPLKFEYLFPFRIIKPRFEAGVNFNLIIAKKQQQGLGMNFPLSAGVLICPVSFLGIDLSVQGEFLPQLDFENFNIYRFIASNRFIASYSFNAGICLRF